MLIFGIIPFDWYLFPFAFGGILTLSKILGILRSRAYLRNTFFYVWITLFLTVFIAPLIHFSRDYWITHVYIEPSNWNTLALTMSCILLYGVFVFYFLESFPIKPYIQKRLWVFKNYAGAFVIILMIISFVLQTVYYIRTGGMTGMIRAYTEREGTEDSFAGLGFYFIFSEMFPYLLLLLYFIVRQKKKTSFLNVLIFLTVMFISAMYFGGLRGSRSNTVFTMFQAVLLIHFTIYRFNKTHFISMIAAFFLFMIIGRIYKNEGEELVKNYAHYEDYRINQSMSGMESIIINDLTRYNIVAYEIFLLENNSFYKPKSGTTYLSSFLTFMPFGTQVRDYFHITSRTEAASQLMYDYDGQQRSNYRKSTRIFGFIGEAMLNFGFLSFFFSFFVVCYLLKLVGRWGDSISTSDARIYFIALLPLIVIFFINMDSTNMLLFVVKRVITMYIILWFITYKIKIQ